MINLVAILIISTKSFFHEYKTQEGIGFRLFCFPIAAGFSGGGRVALFVFLPK